MPGNAMADRVSFFVVSIALLLINHYASGSGEEEAGAFSYTGETGPEKWGSLSPAYSACSQGKSQSPIDIVTNKAQLKADLKPLNRDYHQASNATLVNTDFGIGMHYDDAGVLILDDIKYAAELHLVHADDAGNHVVVGILYRYGNDDPLLAKIKRKLDELAKKECKSNEEARIPVGMFDLTRLKRSTRSRVYYRYHGSLTSPPCSENVLWHVLGRVRTISKKQVEAIKAPLGCGCKSNSRPPQQLNGRSVELYDAAIKK
ncbi:hypothetical protein F0562_016046 [Nyssa sinensis]|uniref:Alpha-carbonic anhydrase domain-containing protein n=1 Tax=Nyssa sinensis TaxID=561372 RepID=A0A5J4ZM55_9ASTE|nr:hypothetical protein F0562_016046 [Nyssa sinensis]